MTIITNGLIAAMLSLLLFSKCNCLEGLKFNQRLPGKYLRSLVQVTTTQCHDECLARKKCKSFNYFAKFHLCKLSEWDTETYTLETDSGCAYAEKRSWEKVLTLGFVGQVYSTHQGSCWYFAFYYVSKNTDEKRAVRNLIRRRVTRPLIWKTVSVLCDTECKDNDVCQLGLNPDSSVPCVVSECIAPAAVDRAQILGNMLHVGAKVLYQCDSQSEPDLSVPDPVVTSECQLDGTWSAVSIKCKEKYVYVGCFTDKETRIFPVVPMYKLEHTLTLAVCYEYCKLHNTDYFGTQWHHFCFCGGATYEQYGPSEGCSFPCDGNHDEICGGDWAMSVYRINQ